ncbi:uncharacterized protein LOC105442897 [Strongylocentrotus purpuratus]|uniref:Ig-like domain-containing protein n=1 Tax=Strongylocentrotus purpuratus TaxID=7668 RepID=A0A7M7T0W5_STRPU|nr:uncharacterized protein LOC105442897 [Strongylocentrotus purpuratus]
MEDTAMPRFQLMDDIQLQDLIDSADSKNTKYAVKYGIKIFEEFLRNVNTDLGDVNRLPNADLDKILQKFYAGCWQKNGDYYSKKSMLTIRFGLQRHFLNTKSVDIIKHEDFANSSRIFKCFSATLKQQGKGFVKHKSPISNGSSYGIMEYRKLLSVLFVLFNAAISQSTQAVTRSVGQNVTLPCSIPVADSDLNWLYWRKNGTTVYSMNGNSVLINLRNYSVKRTTSLVIPDLVETDTGNYSCKITRKLASMAEIGKTLQLYVIDFFVSHCKGTEQEVDGCSCNINGSNITSLECSASGFPHPPVVTWEEDSIIYQSSSINLTRFRENITLVCKARDQNLQYVSANRSVCVYYSIKGGESGKNTGPTQKTRFALGVSLTFVILVVIISLIIFWVYKRRHGTQLCVQDRRSRRTSTPHSVLDDLRFDRIQSRMKSEDETASVGSPLEDYNKDIIFEDAPEVSLPLVGQVLLDDLRSLSDDFKRSLKAVIIRLLNKRVKPYKELPMDASANLNASLLHSSMKNSMTRSASTDRDFAFVELVIQKLDQILDETDRDECEVLITKPDFQEVTDESQIPDYKGNRFINRSMLQSTLLQTSMRSSMNSSRITCSVESSVIREELKTKTPSERTAARNAISQIIVDALGKRRRANQHDLNRSVNMLQTEAQFHGADDLVDDISRIVALWASKIAKLDDEVNNRITEYIFPLKAREPDGSRLADPTGEPVNESLQDPVAETEKGFMKEPIDEPPEETTREVFDEHMKEKPQEPMDSMKGQRETCNEGVDVDACAYSTTSLDDSFQK